MKIVQAFVVFMLAGDSTRLKRWHALRRLCMQRCGIPTTRKHKAAPPAPPASST